MAATPIIISDTGRMIVVSLRDFRCFWSLFTVASDTSAFVEKRHLVGGREA
jgi:hypothetical protein